MKACVISLGCPKNLTDSEVLMGQLAGAGYSISNNFKQADLIIINTCAFLKSARDESWTEIKKAIKSKKRDAKVYIAGCLPNYNNQRLNAAVKNKGNREVYSQVPVLNSINLFDSHTPRIKATHPWTAYVKISEGCDNCCSYCLIPKIRGALRNRPVHDILNEVKLLAKRGVKEIIFVAQDTTAHPRFPALLSQTAKIKGIHWIRIMYAHPAHITDKLIGVMAKEKKIVKYIDLPLQHICDNILSAMRRKISRLDALNLILKLRRRVPNLAIRTTIMVGFPGEGEAEFKELIDFINEVKFEKLGVFKYSQEEGTPAAKMRGQVPEKVKKFRFHKLMSEQNRISKELNLKLVGQTIEILYEGRGGGRSAWDAPEIDGLVKLSPRSSWGKVKPGEFAAVKITGASAYDLTGSLVDT